jgi:hypothetical protein
VGASWLVGRCIFVGYLSASQKRFPGFFIPSIAALRFCSADRRSINFRGIPEANSADLLLKRPRRRSRTGAAGCGLNTGGWANNGIGY